MNSSSKDVAVNSYLLNKKSAYESAIASGAPDPRIKEAKGFLEHLSKQESMMFERRKEMEGFGMLYIELGKFREQLDEMIASYMLGMFQSTISICGTIAERICYDFIDMMELKLNENLLDHSAKEHFYEIPFRHLLSLLVELKFIKKEHADQLHKMYDKRNSYVHAKKLGDSKSDALWCLNSVCRVLEDLFSMNRFYELRDGKYYLRKEFV